MTWSESPGASLTGHLPGSLQQCLGEHLQSPGDDDGHRGRHLPHLVVTLHDLLDPSLKEEHFTNTIQTISGFIQPGTLDCTSSFTPISDIDTNQEE